MGLDEIKDVHFSGGLSLVEWCLGGYIDQIWFEDFVSNTIIGRMLILCRWQMIQAAWECCCRVPAGCFHRLASEWKQHLDALLTLSSNFARLSRNLWISSKVLCVQAAQVLYDSRQAPAYPRSQGFASGSRWANDRALGEAGTRLGLGCASLWKCEALEQDCVQFYQLLILLVVQSAADCIVKNFEVDNSRCTQRSFLASHRAICAMNLFWNTVESWVHLLSKAKQPLRKNSCD